MKEVRSENSNKRTTQTNAQEEKIDTETIR